MRGNTDVDWREDFLLRSATDDVFVPLEVFKTTIKREKSMGRFYSVPSFEKLAVTNVISRRARRIVIQGDAGAGKSTALLRIAYEICQKGPYRFYQMILSSMRSTVFACTETS